MMYTFKTKEEKAAFIREVHELRRDPKFEEFFKNLLTYLSYNIDVNGSISKVDFSEVISRDSQDGKIFVNNTNDSIIREVSLLKGKVMAFQSLINFLQSYTEETKDGKFIIKRTTKHGDAGKPRRDERRR